MAEPKPYSQTRTDQTVTASPALTTSFNGVTTPAKRSVWHSFEVKTQTDVTVAVNWDSGRGGSFSILDAANRSVASASFHGSPFRDSRTVNLSPGNYRVQFNGDYKLSSSYAVNVTMAGVAGRVVRQMPTGSAYPFGPSSEWRRDVSQAPLADNSAAQAGDVARQVKEFYGQAAFNVRTFNTPWYQVPAGQPRADVKFFDCQRKGYVPSTLYKDQNSTLGGVPQVTPGHFRSVPIPDDAQTAPGTDSGFVVYSPSTDQLWEFWKASRLPDGTWQACWGGRIDQVSTSPGFYLHGMGASATGLATAAGSIGIEEAQRGEINHALSLVLPQPSTWKDFSYPAQRSDGFSTSPSAVAEGTRLRLDPTFDVEGSNLHPLAKMVARSAQKYGFIVTDKGGAVSITGESSSGVKTAAGDPWDALMTKPGSTKPTPSYEVFKGFPWDRIQVLPQDYGRP